MAKKNYVLDTSVYLTDADALFKFDNHDIFIPLKVLEEIDKHKKRQDSVGINARRIIRTSMLVGLSEPLTNYVQKVICKKVCASARDRGF
jgi:PhoH-like ATPase